MLGLDSWSRSNSRWLNVQYLVVHLLSSADVCVFHTFDPHLYLVCVNNKEQYDRHTCANAWATEQAWASWQYLLMLAWLITRDLYLDDASCPLHDRNEGLHEGRQKRSTNRYAAAGWAEHHGAARLSYGKSCTWRSTVPYKHTQLLTPTHVCQYCCVQVTQFGWSCCWEMCNATLHARYTSGMMQEVSQRLLPTSEVAGHTETGKRNTLILYRDSPSLLCG